MKKAAVIVAVSLGTLALGAGAYIWMFGGTQSDLAREKRLILQGAFGAKEDRPSSRRGEGEPSDLSGEEKPSAAQEAIARIAPDEYEHKVDGAMTELVLRGGDIGYVDVESLVQNSDPYSVIALLQEHEVLTGAPETVELEMESVVMRTARGYLAFYDQLIGGTATSGEGSVAFDSSGAVHRLHSRLVKPHGAKPDRVTITQSEAKYLAREAIARYVEPRRPDDLRQQPVYVEYHGETLRYSFIPGGSNELRAEWYVEISTLTPPASLGVSVDAQTGEIINTHSLIAQ